jgi:hypothetical protein
MEMWKQTLKRDSIAWITVALLILAVSSPTHGQETKRFEFDTTTGWVSVDLEGKPLSKGGVKAEKGRLSFSYERTGPALLVHYAALLTGLQTLSFHIRSVQPATLVTFVEDRDGAKFHAPTILQAGQWTRVKLSPENFRLNDDSPVKKTMLDPDLLGGGYVLFDLSAVQRIGGTNRIEIDSVEITTSSLPVNKGSLTVHRDTAITKSQVQIGDIRVGKGARMRMRSPRFVLHGNLTCEDGTIEVTDGVMVVPQRFNHQRKFSILSSSRLHFKDALLATSFPLAIDIKGGSSMVMDGVTAAGGITCSLQDNSWVTLRKTRRLGEFVIGPGSHLSAVDSSNMLLWLVLGPQMKGRLSLPHGKEVREWSAKPLLDVKLEACKAIQWGIISAPGAQGEIVSSRLRAVGVYFGGNTKVALHDIHNGQVPRPDAFNTGDRDLRFKDCKVVTWNFYANDSSYITLKDSTFGEAIAFGRSHITVRDSTCDGTGGYIRADNTATVHLVGCVINSRVVARDHAKIILEKCQVTGDVHATDSSTIRLIQTKIRGRIEMDPMAKVLREEP